LIIAGGGIIIEGRGGELSFFLGFEEKKNYWVIFVSKKNARNSDKVNKIKVTYNLTISEKSKQMNVAN
jgi:hypothetical protein